jgi:hypothetical protein
LPPLLLLLLLFSSSHTLYLFRSSLYAKV